MTSRKSLARRRRALMRRLRRARRNVTAPGDRLASLEIALARATRKSSDRANAAWHAHASYIAHEYHDHCRFAWWQRAVKQFQ